MMQWLKDEMERQTQKFIISVCRYLRQNRAEYPLTLRRDLHAQGYAVKSEIKAFDPGSHL